MSGDTKLHGDDRFADVDILSGKIFGEIVLSSNCVEAEPHSPDGLGEASQRATNVHAIQNAVFVAVMRWLARDVQDNREEWAGSDASLLGQAGGETAKSYPQKGQHVQVDPVGNRRVHDGLTRYLALPEIELLEGRPHAFEEEATIAAIRRLMVEQKRDVSLSALPKLEPVDGMEIEAGWVNKEDAGVGERFVGSVLRRSVGSLRGLPALSSRHKALLFLACVSLLFEAQFLLVLALPLLGAFCVLVFLRGCELVIAHLVVGVGSLLSFAERRIHQSKWFVTSSTPQLEDAPSHDDIARILDGKYSVTLEHVLAELGHDRKEMTPQLAKRVSRELRRIGWHPGSSRSSRLHINLTRRAAKRHAA